MQEIGSVMNNYNHSVIWIFWSTALLINSTILYASEKSASCPVPDCDYYVVVEKAYTVKQHVEKHVVCAHYTCYSCPNIKFEDSKDILDHYRTVHPTRHRSAQHWVGKLLNTAQENETSQDIAGNGSIKKCPHCKYCPHPKTSTAAIIRQLIERHAIMRHKVCLECGNTVRYETKKAAVNHYEQMHPSRKKSIVSWLYRKNSKISPVSDQKNLDAPCEIQDLSSYFGMAAHDVAESKSELAITESK